mmetsp:Transcript_23847/g.46208  ORF Transcript_23847/g.46208 Transcript_23847/m.46208 type:complete len:220 (+) Transcript_23847:129-788(+)
MTSYLRKGSRTQNFVRIPGIRTNLFSFRPNTTRFRLILWLLFCLLLQSRRLPLTPLLLHRCRRFLRGNHRQLRRHGIKLHFIHKIFFQSSLHRSQGMKSMLSQCRHRSLRLLHAWGIGAYPSRGFDGVGGVGYGEPRFGQVEEYGMGGGLGELEASVAVVFLFFLRFGVVFGVGGVGIIGPFISGGCRVSRVIDGVFFVGAIHSEEFFLSADIPPVDLD